MKDLLVILSCTSEQGMMAKYRSQLAAAEIDVYVDKIDGFPNSNGGGTLGHQVQGQRRLARQFEEYGKLIFTDAFDVLFYGTGGDVMEKIPDDHVLLAAERNCYPDPSLAPTFPGTTAWRYVNGGMMAGTPERILEWLNEIERHPLYDPNGLNQRFFNLVRYSGSSLVPIDERTELFYCLYLEQNELAFENGLPVNTVLGTHPNFIHANGKWGWPQCVGETL
jgi:hypothetical protein